MKHYVSIKEGELSGAIMNETRFKDGKGNIIIEFTTFKDRDIFIDYLKKCEVEYKIL